jgi:hypothetical protein
MGIFLDKRRGTEIGIPPLHPAVRRFGLIVRNSGRSLNLGHILQARW